jgi:hypothetical protein
MPRSGLATPRGDTESYRAEIDRFRDRRLGRAERLAEPERRTVTIRGQGAEGYATRNGTRVSSAERHRKLKPHERASFRPDRVAMWAVLLGFLLVLAAAASAHAAVLLPH